MPTMTPRWSLSSNSVPICGILELVEFRVLDGDEGVLGEDVLDVAGDDLRPAEKARIVQADDVGRLVGAIAELQQRRARVERHRVLDPGNAAHLVEHVVGQRNRIGDRLHGRIHDPDGGADVDDRGGRAAENAGEQRGHLDHQEHGKGDADQQRRELGAVVDQQLVGNLKNPWHAAAPPDYCEMVQRAHDRGGAGGG